MEEVTVGRPGFDSCGVYYIKGKSESNPYTDPEGSKRLGLPDFKIFGT